MASLNPYTGLQNFFSEKFPKSGGGSEGGTGMPLTNDQAKVLLQATMKRQALHALLSLALNLGLSLQECLQIERKDVNFDDHTLHLKTPIRDIKLTEAPLRAIADHIRNPPTSNGHPPTTLLFNYSDRTIQRAIEDLGLGTLGFSISWSSLRRTWAVRCFENNVRIESMVAYSGASVDSLSKWAVLGKIGKDLPLELFE